LTKNNELSLGSVAKEHSVSRQQVFSWNWKAKQDTLLKTYEKRSATARHVSGAGRPSLIPDGAKERLLSFFDEREAANFSVSPKMLYYDGANPTNVMTVLTPGISSSLHCKNA